MSERRGGDRHDAALRLPARSPLSVSAPSTAVAAMGPGSSFRVRPRPQTDHFSTRVLLMETEKLEALLKLHDNGSNVASAARYLGISPVTALYHVTKTGRTCDSKRNRKIPGKPSAQWAARRLAYFMGMAHEDLCRRSRKRDLVTKRRAAIVVLRRLGYSLPVIASVVNLTDHTTVLHHIRLFDETSSPADRAEVEMMLADIRSASVN